MEVEDVRATSTSEDAFAAVVATVDLGPGERREVPVPGSLRPLQRWDGRQLAVPSGPVHNTAAS